MLSSITTSNRLLHFEQEYQLIEDILDNEYSHIATTSKTNAHKPLLPIPKVEKHTDGRNFFRFPFDFLGSDSTNLLQFRIPDHTVQSSSQAAVIGKYVCVYVLCCVLCERS